MKTDDLISLTGPAAEFAPVKKKSAGLAWLLSMVLPGLGHFYCGLKLRGALVMGFSVAGMAAFWMSIAAQATGRGFDQNVLGAAFLILPVLYVFGFLDAHFTAREINRGIDPTLVDSPRVASVLNLMTRGLGYFYLGERVKGLVVFVGVGLAQMLIPMMLGETQTVVNAVSLVALLLSVAMAIDAYRIGRRSFEAQIAGMDLHAEAPPSRLPVAVPLIAGGIVIGLLVLIIAAGMVAAALGAGQA
jgi:TM2 domain-containing membrane protein YozV